MTQFISSVLVLLICIHPLNAASEASKNDIIDLPGYAFKLSVQTNASKDAIWTLWEEVDKWKSFDERLIYSKLENGGDFENGAVGYLKGKGTPSRTKFVLDNIRPGISFEETLHLPLGQSVLLKRYFEPSQSTTIFTHEVVFQGSMAGLFTTFLEGPFKKDIVLVMNKMKELAEDQTKTTSD